MIAYGRCNGFLTVGYLFNGLRDLDVTVTLSNTVLCIHEWMIIPTNIYITKTFLNGGRTKGCFESGLI